MSPMHLRSLNSIKFSRNLISRLLSSAAETSSGPQAEHHVVLTLATPHQIFLKNALVKQVNLQTESGEMGILAKHVPSIEQLTPGVIHLREVDDTGDNVPGSLGSGKKGEVKGKIEQVAFFCSGGFAVMHPNGQLDIQTPELVPIDQLDSNLVNQNLKNLQSEASQQIAESEESAKKRQVANEIYKRVYDSMLRAIDIYGKK